MPEPDEKEQAEQAKKPMSTPKRQLPDLEEMASGGCHR